MFRPAILARALRRLTGSDGRTLASPAAGPSPDTRSAAADSDGPFATLRRSERPRRSDACATYVAVMEADRFAHLRESLGYGLANALMIELSRRLLSLVPGSEIGRVGRTAVEFAFDAADTDAACAALADAAHALEKRIVIDGLPVDLSVRFGFTDAGGGSIRDELVDEAAAALASAQTGRRVVQFADQAVLTQNRLVGLDLMRRLPGALAGGEFDLAYQPKLDARERTIPSVEALIRWRSPELGQIAPDRFIPVAEETGAIRDLTCWVLDRAIRDQAGLAADGHDLDVYVNISGILLPDRDFARWALDRLAGARGRICFEITETAVIEDPDATLENLAAFSAAGIKIAIDDYGSGLSSLSYLKLLPADELKIDRQFVSGLTQTARDPLLIRSSIDLAHALEMRVTAEGVDDAMALSLLSVMGCDLLQGYLISPPLPLAELRRFLAERPYRGLLAREPGEHRLAAAGGKDG